MAEEVWGWGTPWGQAGAHLSQQLGETTSQQVGETTERRKVCPQAEDRP